MTNDLHSAASNNDVDRIRAFLKRGDNVDTISGGRTPLQCAIEHHAHSAFNVLLQAEAQVCVVLRSKNQKLRACWCTSSLIPEEFVIDYVTVAVLCNNHVALKRLLQYENVLSYFDMAVMPLWVAMIHGDCESLQILMDAGDRRGVCLLSRLIKRNPVFFADAVECYRKLQTVIANASEFACLATLQDIWCLLIRNSRLDSLHVLIAHCTDGLVNLSGDKSGSFQKNVLRGAAMGKSIVLLQSALEACATTIDFDNVDVYAVRLLFTSNIFSALIYRCVRFGFVASSYGGCDYLATIIAARAVGAEFRIDHLIDAIMRIAQHCSGEDAIVVDQLNERLYDEQDALYRLFLNRSYQELVALVCSAALQGNRSISSQLRDFVDCIQNQFLQLLPVLMDPLSDSDIAKVESDAAASRKALGMASLVRWRHLLLNMCTALHPLGLPALVTVTVAQQLDPFLQFLTPFHLLWNLVTIVKHSKD